MLKEKMLHSFFDQKKLYFSTFVQEVLNLVTNKQGMHVVEPDLLEKLKRLNVLEGRIEKLQNVEIELQMDISRLGSSYIKVTGHPYSMPGDRQYRAAGFRISEVKMKKPRLDYSSTFVKEVLSPLRNQKSTHLLKPELMEKLQKLNVLEIRIKKLQNIELKLQRDISIVASSCIRAFINPTRTSGEPCHKERVDKNPRFMKSNFKALNDQAAGYPTPAQKKTLQSFSDQKKRHSSTFVKEVLNLLTNEQGTRVVDPDLLEKLQRLNVLENEIGKLQNAEIELQIDVSRSASSYVRVTANRSDMGGGAVSGDEITDIQRDPKKTNDIQGPPVKKEEQGNSCSECEKTPSELQIFPSSDIESNLKGILYIVGKNNDFEKDKLIQLWMAGGFIEDGPGVKYFEKLESKGYIICSNTNSLYKVNVEKLNMELDIIREHCKCLRLETTSQKMAAASTEAQHVSLIGDEIDEKTFKMLQRFNKLRTLLFLGNYGSRLQQVPRDLFLCLGMLEALDLSGTHIKDLPSSAEKMINLRYLDLSWTFIELLPERIDRFNELQTLKLRGCSRLQRLPREMKRLTKLRHLDLDLLGQSVPFPEGIGALIELQTLSAFLVGEEKGFKICELGNLNKLKGELCLANLENVQSADEAKQASLAFKKNIKKLELRWSDYECEQAKVEDECILENLHPCLHLEEIQIVHYHGTKLPAWMSSVSFHMLLSITLFKCQHIPVLPFWGQLPSLHTLELIGLHSVTKMEFILDVHEVAFPRLKKLSIDEMLSLKTWTEAKDTDFPCLTELSITDCPELTQLPSLVYLPPIKYLDISGCAKLAFGSEKILSSSLMKLIVDDCPIIEERCSEEGGQDWYKIQHVPIVWIDQVEIHQSCEDKNESDTDESC